MLPAPSSAGSVHRGGVGARGLGVVVALGVFLPGVLSAQPGPRRPADPRRYAAAAPETAVRVAPLPEAPRRGTLGAGAPLPVLERRGGPGCEAGWARVAPDGWVCAEHLVPVAAGAPAGPGGRARRARAAPAGSAEAPVLPYTYALVVSDGLPFYERPSDARLGRVVGSLGEGFGLAVVGERTVDGIPFVETRRGFFVERAGLGFPRPSTFSGVRVPGPARLPVWTFRDPTPFRPRSRGPGVRWAPRRVLWTAEDAPSGRGRVAVEAPDGTAGTVPARAVRVVRRPPPLAPPPGPTERWVAVDVGEQTVTAFEGERPVWATLASTGRAAHPTPPGVHRIWVKLRSSNMSDLERDDVRRNYALEAVPWVLYFADGVGFHAAFWHDDFGRPRSHGCVNLAPRDARWLFRFVAPELPAGWTAVLPTRQDPGSRVLVWDSSAPAGSDP